MPGPRNEFLSDEDLALAELSDDELMAEWNRWLLQMQATNDEDACDYTHGVMLLVKEPRLDRVR